MERLKMMLMLFWGMGNGIVFVTGQNLIPNPGFETSTLCPTAAGQFNGYAANWSAANAASPDYAACGFTGTSFTRITPATGGAAAGIWGATGHPNCAGSAYAENVTAVLTAPLVPGTDYQVSFAVMVDGLGSSTAGPNACVNVGLYFYPAATPPAVNGMCCMAVTPQLSVQADLVTEGSYATFSGNFTAAAACDRVQLGVFCNGNSGTAFCNDFANRRMYFNFDNVSLTAVSPLGLDLPGIRANVLPQGNLIEWEGNEWSPVQIWKSADGETFTLIQEINSNSWLDAGEWRPQLWYRLSARNSEGIWVQSEVLSVKRETNAIEISATADGWRVSGLSGEWEGSLWDATGRRLGTIKGYGEMEVPAPGAGIYLLRVGDGVSRGIFFF